MKVHIILQELMEDGIFTIYSNGHVAVLPYLIDKNGENYVKMFYGGIEQH